MVGWVVASLVLSGAAVVVASAGRRLEARLPALTERADALDDRRAALTGAAEALARTRTRAADLAERTRTSAEAAH